MSQGSEPHHHVLVVDDDTRIRTLLQRYLTQNGYRVSAAKDAAEARERLRSLEFDLLILDVMMPGESGFDLTRSLRQTTNVPILLLTARGEAADRVNGLERGADDYLTKPFEPKELLLRVAGLLRRAAPQREAERSVSLGRHRFDLQHGDLVRDGQRVRLTGAELQLLRILAESPNAPFTRAELCARTGAGSERSVDVQVTRLRRKIEDDPRLPLYIQTVRGVGYVLVPDRPI